MSEVEKVFRELQENPDPNVKKKAHEWLLEFQKSKEAWEICFQLFSSQYVEVQYFAALTLQIKVNSGWNKLETDRQQLIKNEVLKQSVIFSSKQSIVLTKLCVVIVSIGLHTFPEQWPQMILDVLNQFQFLANGKNIDILIIEYLSVLPEEYVSANFGQSRKKLVFEELTKSIPQVLSILTGYLSPSNDKQLKNRSLKGIQNWFRFGIPLELIGSLIPMILTELSSPEYYENCIEILIEFARSSQDLSPAILCNLIPFIISKKMEIEKAFSDEDESYLLPMCRLIISIAENATFYLVSNFSKNQEIQQFFSLILLFTNYPGNYPVDQEISVIPLNFWYLLTECCLDDQDNPNLEIIQFLNPVFYELIRILCLKCQYPQESEYLSWPNDDKQSFERSRSDIAETFLYISQIYHEFTLETILGLLESKIGSKFWQEIESTFFALVSIGSIIQKKSLTENQGKKLVEVISFLRTFQCNGKLPETILLFYGSYGFIIKNDSQLFGDLVNQILQSFRIEQLSLAASMSLKSLCSSCPETTSKYCPGFLQLYLNLEAHVQTKARVNLIESISILLNPLALETVVEGLSLIVRKNLESLDAILISPKETDRDQVASKLEQLVACCQYIKSPPNVVASLRSQKLEHPFQFVFKSTLPYLEKILSLWRKDEETMKLLCQIIDESLRTLDDQIGKESFVLMCQILITGYQNSNFPCFLVTAAMVVSTFSPSLSAVYSEINSSSEHYSIIQTLLQLLYQLSLTTFQINLFLSPDIIENYFRLLVRYLRTCPIAFFENDQNLLLKIFEFLISVLSLDQKEILETSLTFFNEFITKDFHDQRYHDTSKKVMIDNIDALVRELLLGIGGRAPRNTISPFCQSFFILKNSYPEQFRFSLIKWLQQDKFPTEEVSQDEKKIFLDQIFSNLSEPKFKDMIKDFALKCRNLENTTF